MLLSIRGLSISFSFPPRGRRSRKMRREWPVRSFCMCMCLIFLMKLTVLHLFELQNLENNYFYMKYLSLKYHKIRRSVCSAGSKRRTAESRRRGRCSFSRPAHRPNFSGLAELGVLFNLPDVAHFSVCPCCGAGHWLLFGSLQSITDQKDQG